MPSKRRLAAILFADIAGYTAMMQRDENDGLQRIRYFRMVLDEQVRVHGGEILQHYGDGSLVIFASAVDAVSCARDIQVRLNRDEEGEAGMLSVPVRIGIHVGDIVVDGNNIFGDGVNLASRIETIAAPGSILITERVTYDLRSHPEFKIVSLGNFRLKNVTLPMPVYALAGEGIPVPKRSELREQLRLSGGEDEEFRASRRKRLILAFVLMAAIAVAAGLLGPWRRSEEPPEVAQRFPRGKTIAVLPFRDLSPEGDQAYIGSGIAEEVLSSLAKLPGWKVTGRTSSFYFTEEDLDVPAIGEKLGVSTVLQGSVRKAGERIRIAAQLYETEDGYVLWSDRYERGADDIFAIQDEIAQAVAGELQVILSNGERAFSRNPSNRQAYEWYLRGKYMLSQRVDGAQKAVEFFEEALEEDPVFAPAHAGLANACIWLAWGNYLPSGEAFSRARRHATRALELDPSLAYAQATLGSVRLWYDWDWAAAREALEKAVAINPSEGSAHINLGWLNLISGDFEEAFTCGQQAIDLDPLNLEYNIDLADFKRMAGQYEASLEAGRAMQRIYPDNSDPLWIVGQAQYHLADFAAAEAAFREATALSEEPTLYLIHQAMALAKLKRNGEARQILEKLKQEEDLEEVAPVELAMLHCALEERENALDLLERSYDMHANWLISIGADPIWEVLQGEPRFEALLEHMDFPERQ